MCNSVLTALASELRMQATITFDGNAAAAIKTNVWLNTLDRVAPTATTVLPLPPGVTAGDEATVSWTIVDQVTSFAFACFCHLLLALLAFVIYYSLCLLLLPTLTFFHCIPLLLLYQGAGFGEVDIFVSVDGEQNVAASAFAVSSPEASGEWQLRMRPEWVGATVGVEVIATDAAGMREVPRNTPQTSTLVLDNAIVLTDGGDVSAPVHWFIAISALGATTWLLAIGVLAA
jgi:hypothetical protein